MSSASNLKKRMQNILDAVETDGVILKGNAARNPKKNNSGDRVKKAERVERSVENIMKSNPTLTLDEAEVIAKGPRGNAARVPKANAQNVRQPKAQQRAKRGENSAVWGAVDAANQVGVDQAIGAVGESAGNGFDASANPNAPKSSNNCREHPLQCQSAAEGARNPDTVKNCKRSNSLGNEMSDKCKQILRMIGEQVNSSGVKMAESGMPYTDLKTTWEKGREIDPKQHNSKHCMEMAQKYGNDLQESEKYYSDIYMKGMAGNKSVIADTERMNDNTHLGKATYDSLLPGDIMNGGPFSVRAANCYGRKQAGTIYTKAPIMTGHEIDPTRMKQLLTEFFRDKEAFMRIHGEFDYETIAIKGVLIAINEEDEMGMATGGGGGGLLASDSGFGDVSAPQPLAASNSVLEDIKHYGDTIAKIYEQPTPIVIDVSKESVMGNIDNINKARSPHYCDLKTLTDVDRETLMKGDWVEVPSTLVSYPTMAKTDEQKATIDNLRKLKKAQK